ncbi:hypothetical protein ACIA8O_15750 [Kitasatospora sp. NPDC051853]|uniref:hypothetical protein n=1 Tax=Kitasatospora sp. NPDC051853 TaxID=3364058 RepID=UPI0037A7B016
MTSQPTGAFDTPGASDIPDAFVTAADLRALLGEELHAEAAAQAAAITGALPQDAERQVLECLRYLYLISRHPDALAGLFLPVEQHIDEVWHFLILQTREYAAFCERLPGGFFVHHRSIGYEAYEQEPGRERAAEEALRWIPLYCREFGPFDEDAMAHWTIVRYLHQQLDMSLAEISELQPLAAR